MLKVYSCNQAADDLLLIGKMHAGMKNGEVVEIEFCARMMFQQGKEKTPKVNLYQAWMVCNRGLNTFQLWIPSLDDDSLLIASCEKDPSPISAAAKGA